MKPAVVPLILSSMLALPLDLADALRVGLQGKHARPQLLTRRASLAGTTVLNDTSNIQYSTNITLGGNQFSVLIDTGSSDLFVTGSVPGAKNTGASAGIQFAVGSVQGPVQLATLDFAGFTVQDQAFISVPPDQNNLVGTGLIGLGPNNGSQVHDALKDQQGGDAVLDRIFQQNTTTPNFITILLSRDDDPGESFPGDLTVGEVLPGFEAITSQPQLPVTTVPIFDTGDQHWQTLLDPNGIIGPDGKAIDVKTGVASTKNPKQLTAVFDTGFSLPQVPKSVSDAIYGDVPGAQFVTNDADFGPIWTLPCNVEINISFNLGGKNFPVHPLDTNLDLNVTDPRGRRVCIGAFQPISTARSPNFDLILGMAFIRNAYLLINFGDFVDGKLDKTAPPFIQLLSITNSSTDADRDFAKVRGNVVVFTGGSRSFVRTHTALVIGLAIAFGALLLFASIFVFMRHRKLRRTPAGFVNIQSSYQPIGSQAPLPAYDMQPVGGYAPPPGPPPGNYNSPWDARY